MHALNLPPFQVKTQTDPEGNTKIWDFLRKRYVRLTPEESLRQHFTHYLTTEKDYPSTLLANEVTINVCGVSRRCDSVLYSPKGGLPRVIIEYKAPHIAITQAVFQQILSYNSVLKADYLMVSNGMSHYCCHIDYKAMKAEYLRDIPHYSCLE